MHFLQRCRFSRCDFRTLWFFSRPLKFYNVVRKQLPKISQRCKNQYLLQKYNVPEITTYGKLQRPKHVVIFRHPPDVISWHVVILKITTYHKITTLWKNKTGPQKYNVVKYVKDICWKLQRCKMYIFTTYPL